MDIETVLSTLNTEQRAAVTVEQGANLILAGAGSGKTRVLIHRMAWLIKTKQYLPQQLLAVTFTNKAANEMRSRIEQLFNIPVKNLWVGTFHGLALRLLRRHWREAKLLEQFQVIDADDQLRMVKRLMRDLQIDEARWPAKQVVWFINNKKDEGIRAGSLLELGDPYNKTMRTLYESYEKVCQQNGLVDFAELLFKVHELWRDNPELLSHYQYRFKEVLVDEFQDTNTIQYAWLRLLVGKTVPLMAVGDDDQSIYGWRGAKIENIQRFSTDFPNAKILRLEQNYRSSGYILKAANHLIGNNQGRLGKELWTQKGDGEPISVYMAVNEIDEAQFVVKQLAHSVSAQGRQYHDVAILYRANAQSRVLEEALIHKNIPYKIYGGQRFFERAEIKDVLAYLRLIQHKGDNAAFERIINWPTRGIGNKTIEQLRAYAKNHECSLWNAVLSCEQQTQLLPRAKLALVKFRQLIEELELNTSTLTLPEQVELVIKKSQLLAHYQKEKGEVGRSRLENLNELVLAAKQFIKEREVEENSVDVTSNRVLMDFLANCVLESGTDQSVSDQSCVQLMTLHSAKGLEFPLVFLVGLEEKLFPHQMSLGSDSGVEEERRLCYVGMTRAMEQLYLSYAQTRRFYGSDVYNQPSRFLKELPPKTLNMCRFEQKQIVSTTTKCNLTNAVESRGALKLGQRVQHAKFGEGVIVSFEGQGAQARVQVQFIQVGTKWLMINYANLSSIN